jgi:GTP diphosphokinase / guanosine-3',5'-bis(diphosphate) 3'-diphosphatase
MDNVTTGPNGMHLHTFAEVQEVFFAYITKPEDREKIQKAYEFANEKHAGVFRKSGEPYIHHLIEVAYILAQLQAGPATITAGFLHDVVEDTDVTLDDIRRLFGDEVAMFRKKEGTKVCPG